MFWLWCFVLMVGFIIRSDMMVAISIICINIHYVADKIIKCVEKAAQ